MSLLEAPEDLFKRWFEIARYGNCEWLCMGKRSQGTPE
jgi:hypothetical protein